MLATVVLPVKRFGHAKQRLLEVLDRPARAAIAKATLADVLAALARAELVERVIVVTGEGRAERLALRAAERARLSLEVLREPDDRGHSEAATLGIVRALAHGADATALLPGDCPLLDPGDLDGALARLEPGTVAVIPDRHGTGTNGLLLSPADAIGPAFGEGSRERHTDRARRAGHRVAIEELPSLALDLDTPDDLDRLVEALAADPARAPATSAELERLGLLGAADRGRP